MTRQTTSQEQTMTTATPRRINLSLARPGQVIRHGSVNYTVVRQLPASLGRCLVRVTAPGAAEAMTLHGDAAATLVYLDADASATHEGTCRGCGHRVTGTAVIGEKALADATGGDALHAARCVTATGAVRTDGFPRPLA
jgi:hypothetical protein